MILPVIVRSCLLGAVAERPFAPGKDSCAARSSPSGERPRAPSTWSAMAAARLHQLPRRGICGRTVAVAVGPRARLLGLAGLSREQAGTGLLIPRCASVHTFGMRFDLDLVFLDHDERPLAIRLGVPPRRLAWQPGAAAVLEIPSV